MKTPLTAKIRGGVKALGQVAGNGKSYSVTL